MTTSDSGKSSYSYQLFALLAFSLHFHSKFHTLTRSGDCESQAATLRSILPVRQSQKHAPDATISSTWKSSSYAKRCPYTDRLEGNCGIYHQSEPITSLWPTETVSRPVWGIRRLQGHGNSNTLPDTHRWRNPWKILGALKTGIMVVRTR